MHKILPAIALLLTLPCTANSQHTHAHERAIEFPDVPNYLTLKCDFHMHTVFSDGNVWPRIRVKEALRDGLDAISITDHLENQPHKDDIPHPDRNRSYQIASEEAEDEPLIIINGSEVTREMPPGHCNAIFLQDANPLLKDDPMVVFREAKRQDAFTFWNHPAWRAQRPDGMATLTDMHRQLIEENLIQGIEVVNDKVYSDEALQIALDHNLTIMGNSDIHDLIDWSYDVPEGGHRPVTLVFAAERTAASIKEALEARRTAVWHDNTLIGRVEHLLPLIKASLTVKRAYYRSDSTILTVNIENTSDVEYLLKNQTGLTFRFSADVITLEPHSTTRIDVKTVDQKTSVTLDFEVLNAVTAPNTHPTVTFEVAVE